MLTVFLSFLSNLPTKSLPNLMQPSPNTKLSVRPPWNSSNPAFQPGTIHRSGHKSLSTANPAHHCPATNPGMTILQPPTTSPTPLAWLWGDSALTARAYSPRLPPWRFRLESSTSPSTPTTTACSTPPANPLQTPGPGTEMLSPGAHPFTLGCGSPFS